MSASGTDKKERLSAARIVDVAIKQLRERGYEAVTMRSIALELGTGAASLYAHVANRNELDGLVMSRISTKLQLPEPDPARWDEQLAQMARDMLRLYREHPGTARCSMGNVPASPEAFRPVEGMFAILRAGGVSDQDASWFGDQFALHVSGFAVEEDIWRARAAAVGETVEDSLGQFPAIFAQLTPEEFPVLHSLGAALTAGDADERFSFGMDLLIQGLKARTRAS